MDQNREVKMQLLKEFGISDDKKTVDFCREAYKFLTEEEEATPSPQYQVSPEPVAIDLGLPSGTLWCDRNIGAKQASDFGAFFSWGNTDLHFPNIENMDWGDDDDAFDYKFTSEEYKKTPGYKLKDDIDLEHDAARVNMGDPWQMPTAEQFEELFEYCTWTRRTFNNVNGYLVISKINGNLLFFPCSGYGSGTTWYHRGTRGYYWSGSIAGTTTGGLLLLFYSGGVHPQYSYARFFGFTGRAVQRRS